MNSVCNIAISLKQEKYKRTTSLQLLYKGVGEQEATVTCFKRKEVSGTCLLMSHVQLPHRLNKKPQPFKKSPSSFWIPTGFEVCPAVLLCQH